MASIDQIVSLLGDKADPLLKFSSPKIARNRLHVPGPDFIDRIFTPSDRNNRVLVNLQRHLGSGRLAGTGYLSILPVGIAKDREDAVDGFNRDAQKEGSRVF